MEKYLPKDSSRPLTKKQKLVEKANSQVRIEWVLKDLFDIYVPEDSTSWRAKCPWGNEHSDKGVTKAFRVYSETNSGMCFAMHGQCSPVKLWAYENSLPWYVAASKMLNFYNLTERRESYYDKMIRMVEEEPELPPLNMEYLVQHILPTHPKYLKNQYNPEVRSLVNRWTDAEFPTDHDKSYAEFIKWKEKMWELLDTLGP